MNLFQELCSRAAIADISKDPNQMPVGKGEEVLGVMSDETKRLYVVFEEEGRKMAALREEMRRAVDATENLTVKKARAELDRLNKKCYFMNQRTEAVSKLFWATIEAELADAYDVINSGGTGVRAGWKLVKLAHREIQDLVVHIGPPIMVDDDVLAKMMGRKGHSAAHGGSRKPSVN